MKYLELKNTVEKLLDFMERYNLDDYNERQKMNKINDELGELKKKLANYELI